MEVEVLERMNAALLDDSYRMTREQRQRAMEELNARRDAYEKEHDVCLADRRRLYRQIEEISRNWG
ncbi:MAG: hypothetical protein Q4C58_12950 [Eubacteriales bacterium]|nr:hypothetical protein [Eubacteriales bacterium]